jgi:hypothetical protein
MELKVADTLAESLRARNRYQPACRQPVIRCKLGSCESHPIVFPLRADELSNEINSQVQKQKSNVRGDDTKKNCEQ